MKRSNIARYAERPLQHLPRVMRDNGKVHPVGGDRLGAVAVRNRVEPLLGHIATGQVPVDADTAPIVADALGALHRKMVKELQ